MSVDEEKGNDIRYAVDNPPCPRTSPVVDECDLLDDTDESILLSCLEDLKSEDNSCEDTLAALRAAIVKLQETQGAHSTMLSTDHAPYHDPRVPIDHASAVEFTALPTEQILPLPCTLNIILDAKQAQALHEFDNASAVGPKFSCTRSELLARLQKLALSA